ncbi:hypothetical protein H2200_009699 [Cladophialophora chaetospira]|uniref:Uncharacterized protein n=1 Tax=Cladophialophora chaetospira TaxID=386627 RepID=A0AA38X306_9EURO|nr:hypothetical protein H2200_009699 [Cladophialophora chaetospira]
MTVSNSDGQQHSLLNHHCLLAVPSPLPHLKGAQQHLRHSKYRRRSENNTAGTIFNMFTPNFAEQAFALEQGSPLPIANMPGVETPICETSEDAPHQIALDGSMKANIQLMMTTIQPAESEDVPPAPKSTPLPASAHQVRPFPYRMLLFAIGCIQIALVAVLCTIYFGYRGTWSLALLCSYVGWYLGTVGIGLLRQYRMGMKTLEMDRKMKFPWQQAG